VGIDESTIAGIPRRQGRTPKGDFIGVVAPKEGPPIKAAPIYECMVAGERPLPRYGQLYDHIRKAPVNEEATDGKWQCRGSIARRRRSSKPSMNGRSNRHASMGPGLCRRRCSPDGVTLWTGTQKPHFAAQGFGARLGRCRWRKCTRSGSRVQGLTVATTRAMLTMDAAVLSQAVGKAVRVQYMRLRGPWLDPKARRPCTKGRAALDEKGNVLAIEFNSKGLFAARDQLDGGRSR